MKYAAAIAFGFLTVPTAALAQGVYKCIDGGRVTLQQAPCPGGQKFEVRVNDLGGPAKSSPMESTQAELNSARQSAVSEGLQRGYPVVGMNQHELRQVLGEPDRINTSDYGRGPEEQRIYDRDDRTIYVYTANGVVRSLQNNARIGGRKVPCPTATDIRNLEVSASSITLSEGRKIELDRQLRAMRQCR